VLSLFCGLFSPAAWAKEYPVISNIAVGIAVASLDPTQPPPGTNHWQCVPSEQHPNPVVLIPGTFGNMVDDYGAVAPELANAGYCVFSLNYGGHPGDLIQAIGPMHASALQIAAFISQVLTATGADKVDLVGHSQGGTLIEYYVKALHGAPNVNKLVALGPTTHGTTLSGLLYLARVIPGALNVVKTACPACKDQEKDSAFIQRLNQGPITRPGVDYTIIASRYNVVVTPAGSASFIDEPGVNNEYVQDFCHWDFVDHADLSYDQTVIQLVMNALDPSTAQAPNCFRSFPVPAY
jgi:pimeloyl-ACP methyl ester carboxylesterase